MTLATGSELNQETFDDFVQRLRHHVRGEGVSWHHTADAMFTVQARKIIFGIDPDYTDKLAVGIEDSMYFSPQEYWDSCDEEYQKKLDGIALKDRDSEFLALPQDVQWEIIGDLPDHTVSGWDDRWEVVNAHFTKEAAEAFIKRKKHDYRDGLRVYVEAQVYCWEFNAIIAGLMDGRIKLAEAQPAAEHAKPEPVEFMSDSAPPRAAAENELNQALAGGGEHFGQHLRATVTPEVSQVKLADGFEAWVTSPLSPIPAGTSWENPLVTIARAAWNFSGQQAGAVQEQPKSAGVEENGRSDTNLLQASTTGFDCACQVNDAGELVLCGPCESGLSTSAEDAVYAGRYRYLRDALPSHTGLWVAMGIPGQGCSSWHGEELDARIDLEIAQKGK